VLVALIVAGIVVAVASSGGGSSASDIAKQTINKGSVPAAAERGARTTPPPWQPVYTGLPDRISAMGLPGLSDTAFHIHAWLHVYVDGKRVPVPPNIGLDEVTGTFSPLHTHDASGVIHMEGDEAYPFTLGQVFAIWGVRFSNGQLGSLEAGHGKTLQVYFNGKRVNDPVDEVMHEHTNISVGYGKPGSFPTKPPANFPAGE
jgi:hypothetical protein